MLVVGLTGGIASGKTTVSNLFATHGTPVIDADIVGRQLLDPGQPGYQLLLDRLGDDILDPDGFINRQMLREKVFNQAELKSWLEQQLHPLIYQGCQQRLADNNPKPYAILVVPLMFETSFYQLANRFCVIDCPLEIQLKRLTERDGIDQQLAEKMINSQMDNTTRLSYADDIISNTGSLESLGQQVLKLHESYLRLSSTNAG